MRVLLRMIHSGIQKSSIEDNPNQSASERLDFSTLSIQETFDQLDTTLAGLSDEQTSDRIKHYGKNIIPDARRASPLLILFKQFKSLLVYVLIVAALLSYTTGNPTDAYIILIVVLIDAAIGFAQERRAEKAVKSLRKILSPSAKVFRNGSLKVMDGTELVPGDIIYLEEGDKIAADARLIEARDVRTLESALTGESLPVSKTTDSIAAVGVLVR
jgi:P-type Ca2+ transporter type 2C